MKQIIQLEQCQRCRECCRFREDRQYFAPLFTTDELAALQAERGELPSFHRYQDSDNVFQIDLIPAKVEHPIYKYVCPFLDEEGYACTVYEQRPFDCRTWPMIVHHEPGENNKLVSSFTGDVCLALRETTEEDLQEYREYFANLMTQPAYIELFKRHPELVWEHGEEASYQTVLIRDITTLFSDDAAP
jgi:Fe-S-cluster containining protein